MSEESRQPDLKVYSQEVYDDPYPTYAELRARCPVYRDPETGDFLISRYKEVYDGLLDPETFSNAGYLDDGYYRDKGLIIAGQDEPRHGELRDPLNPVFRRDNLEAMQPQIEAIVDDLVAKLPAGEIVDVAEQYAWPLPGRAMAVLIGFPQEDYAEVSAIAFSVVGWWRGMDESGSDKFDAYFKPIIEARRREPRNDVISVLLASNAYSEMDLLRAIYFMVLAGIETTRDAITVMTKELAERPDLWAELRANRNLVASAVEEAVRMGSPTQRIRKRATRDVEIAGTTIPKDARVQFVLAAASRDEEVFSCPDDFQLSRRTKLGDIRHVSFGKGVHACLGAPLARLEMRLLLNALLDKFEGLELVEIGGVGKAKTTRGYEHLSVRFR